MKSPKTPFPKDLKIALVAFIALSFLRFIVFRSETFFYLIWNVFVAYLLFLFSAVILNFKDRGVTGKISVIFGGILWLLFFPNAPYVVTDFIHLSQNSLAPLWYDALLLASSAWVGLLFGMYSLFNVEVLLKRYFSTRILWMILIIAMLFSSFGIYLGRFLRWNSWDVVINPLELLQDIWFVLAHPFINFQAYVFMIIFFIFILGTYLWWRPMQNKNINL